MRGLDLQARELASDGKGLCDSVLADSIKFSLGFGLVGGQNRTTVGFLLSNADEFFAVYETVTGTHFRSPAKVHCFCGLC